MRWLVRKVLALFRPEPAINGSAPDAAAHHATLSRADRLLRVVNEYEAAEQARRDRR